MPDKNINVVATIKDGHRYVVLCDDEHKDAAMQTLGKWARDPRLNLDWHDAARMAKSLRASVETCCEGK